MSLISLLVCAFTVLLLAFTLLVLGLGLRLKSADDREKSSPFECGFTPKFLARLPFSIRFFIVALVFLIFDVELILIFPLVPATASAEPQILMITFFILLVILVIGLAHEVFEGSLAWAF